MIAKESPLYSILKGRCPRCHEGEVFLFRNPYKNFKFIKMHDQCAVCRQSYNPEPGFYWGAMYASYAVTVAICLVLGGGLLFTNLKAEVILLILFGVLTVLLPIIFRLSRLIWLHIFIGYNPKIARQVKEHI